MTNIEGDFWVDLGEIVSIFLQEDYNPEELSKKISSKIKYK
jgi:hypothetical protein